jgi:hypothetical protein
MTDQKILDNAPEGATHIDSDGEYAKDAGYGLEFFRLTWCAYAHPVELRSLADIKELVELRNEKAELVTQNQRLKVIITERESVIDNLRSVKSEMEGERYLKDKCIAELEKERDVLTAFIIKRMPPIKAMSSIYEICKIIADEVDSILEAHNLEQKIKGIESIIQTGDYVSNKWLREEVENLRSEAKALKEGKG